MKSAKRVLSVILCFVMVLTIFQGTTVGASAKVVGSDNKTQLTITQDKSKYSWGDTIVFNVDVKNEERLDLIITCNIPDSINGTDYPVIVLDMFDALGNKYTKYFSYNSISEAYRTQIESSKKINSKEEWISNKENYTSFNIDKQNKQIIIPHPKRNDFML